MQAGRERRGRALVWLAWGAALLACGTPEESPDGEDGPVSTELRPYPGPADDQIRYAEGEELFRLGTELGGNNANVFACLDCHNRNAADLAEDAVLLKPGHSLYGVSRRETWLDGTTAALVDGVNFCVVTFLGGVAVGADDEDMNALLGYLISISREGEFPALDWRIDSFTEAQVSPGDPTLGAEVFGRACLNCHGSSGEGNDFGPAIVGTELSDLDLANTIRAGRGIMPPFSEDRMSNAEVMNTLAFVLSL